MALGASQSRYASRDASRCGQLVGAVYPRTHALDLSLYTYNASSAHGLALCHRRPTGLSARRVEHSVDSLLRLWRVLCAQPHRIRRSLDDDAARRESIESASELARRKC